MKSTYWVSGDIGCPGSLPLFWEKDPEHNITYGACGLGETEKDAMIEVKLDSMEAISFRAVSLTRQQLEPLESYGIKYWNESFKAKKSSAIRIPILLRRSHFYIGIGFGVFLASAALLVGKSLTGRRF